jgi:hypothetical protein
MIFDSSFDGVDLCDSLMVVRREKAFRSVPSIGREVATQTWDDANLGIDAVNAVIRRSRRERALFGR